MSIVYDTRKDIPCDQLYELFKAVGWTDGEETPFMLNNFNAPFINSTLVFSAWENGELVGCVRVLSDQITRSIIYDLAVLPEFQKRGIGKELVKKCIGQFKGSEWLVETRKKTAGFYEMIGFKPEDGVFLSIPSKWF